MVCVVCRPAGGQVQSRQPAGVQGRTTESAQQLRHGLPQGHCLAEWLQETDPVKLRISLLL